MGHADAWNDYICIGLIGPTRDGHWTIKAIGKTLIGSVHGLRSWPWGHGGQVQGQVRAGPFSSWRRTRTEYRKYILWLTSFKQGMDNICCDCNSSYVLLQRLILFCLLCTYEEITKWVGPFRNYTWWLSLTTQRNWECKGNALVLVFL